MIALISLITYFAIAPKHLLAETPHIQTPIKESISNVTSRQVPRRATNVDQRHNYCGVYKQVQFGNVSRRDALKHLNVSIGVDSSNFVEQEISDVMRINSLSLEVFNEIANRGNFRYRDSYQVIPPPQSNETYTDSLVYTLDRNDVAVDYWVRSVERTNLGITGATNWYDASTIIMHTKDASLKGFNILSIFDPFTSIVWLLIFCTIIVSGIVYHIIDYAIHRGNPEEGERLGGNLFKTALAFMCDNTFDPKFAANRILIVSISFLSLILVAAYTANLATFLVNNNQKRNIDTFEDVIKFEYRVCVHRGTQNVILVQSEYPKARYVEKATLLEVYQGVSNKECQVGLTTVEDYKTYQNRIEYNPNCVLQVIEKPVRVDGSSFALKYDAEYCSAILRDILDLFILEMIDDGTLENIKSEFYKGTQTCGEKSRGNDSLSLKDIGGVFVLHYSLLVLALIITALHVIWPSCCHSSIGNIPVVSSVSSFIGNIASSFLTKRSTQTVVRANESIDKDFGNSAMNSTITSNNKIMDELLKLKSEMKSQMSEIMISQDEMKRSQADMQTSQIRKRRQVPRERKTSMGEF